ncbi:MAG: fibronectin type III domain-containing protein [Candidatus Dojkabacteria bacterium]|nr:MAG: fibronectin type III domain-containing protein [Candidatus Dojkabacteria bacterium]
MNPLSKIHGLLLISAMIVSLVVGLLILSSQSDLSVSPSQAANTTTIIPEITPEITENPNPTILPLSGSQDFRLRQNSQPREESPQTPSYLYTELTTKGVVSNVTATSVSIFWLTEAPQPTKLQYGIQQSQLVRVYSSPTDTFIHEAKMTNLTANTLYFFTGHAPIIESLTTPNSLPLLTKSTKVSGTVPTSDTCIVRGEVSRTGETSASLTTLSREGKWELDFGKVRTSDLSQYYKIQDLDTVFFEALCVSPRKVLSAGSLTRQFGVAENSPVVIGVTRIN